MIKIIIVREFYRYYLFLLNMKLYSVTILMAIPYQN